MHVSFSHCQCRLKVDLIHLIENRYDSLVLVVLASRSENDTKAIRTHLLNSLNNVNVTWAKGGGRVLKESVGLGPRSHRKMPVRDDTY